MSADQGLRDLYNRKYANREWHPLTLKPNGISTNRYDDAARLIQGEKGEFLEVGCGAGQMVLALADRFDRLIGVDLSDVRVTDAKQALKEHYPQFQDKIDFVTVGSSGPFPFQDGSFDVVISLAVLEHVIDVFEFMDEIARVCRPGGCTVITVPNICYVKHAFRLLLGRIPITGIGNSDIAYWRENGWDGGHFHYFSKKMLGDLLENAGFEPEKWTSDGKFAKFRRWHPNLVGHLSVRARRL